MDVIEKNLNIVFLEMLPERVLQSISDSIYFGTKKDGVAANNITLDSYTQYARVHWKDFSDDEHEMLFDNMQGMMKDSPCIGYPETTSVFWVLVDCGKRYLVRKSDILMCQFAEIANWNRVYHNIGQDLVTTAFVAYENLRRNVETCDFSWNAVLRSDNGELNNMLAKGMADNHFHLGGSAQSFPLTWCCMMNLPGHCAPLVRKILGRNLYAGISLGVGDNVLPWDERMELAAFIRALLYERIQDPKINVRERFSGYMRSFSHFSETERMVERLRYIYGTEMEFLGGKRFCMDYAMESTDKGPFRILAGERRLMYQCFKASFSNQFSEMENNLFYLYLLLKSNFRREFIQVNRRVGFANFSEYQKRKDTIWKGITPYEYEATNLALNGALAVPAIQTLEARLSPSETPEKIRKLIWDIDRAKRHADGQNGHAADAVSAPRVPTWSMENFAAGERYFFTLHFNKRKDTYKCSDFFRLPRHAELRQKNRTKARALASALCKSDYLCQRIRGIDACSNEIGCRPEVFASDFRFLRYSLTGQRSSHNAGRCSTPMLSVTYHAGEDFLDIADGLRAIDEAIFFLNYKRGDRLGHALALGIEPGPYYERKGYRIVQPIQDRLDDLVWCLYRGSELAELPGQLCRRMEDEAWQLLREIYPEYKHSNALFDYYKSWKLRGDAPDRYATGQYERPGLFVDPYYDYQVNEEDSELAMLRQNDMICDLYYRYHYDPDVRKSGKKVEVFDISREYAKFMRDVQNGMQHYIAERGIMIECNPSSNVLIGTFEEYHRHPILRFYNRGLTISEKETQHCAQLNVSVNTDDLGIFDTSLEFEYALLANALSCSSAYGAEQHSFAEVKTYLNQIRKMGIEQVFPSCQRI